VGSIAKSFWNNIRGIVEWWAIKFAGLDFFDAKNAKEEKVRRAFFTISLPLCAFASSL
jgi:hypothetical protein